MGAQVYVGIFEKLSGVELHAAPEGADHAAAFDVIAVLIGGYGQQVKILRKCSYVVAPDFDCFLLAQCLKGVLVERQGPFVHTSLQFFLGLFYGDAAHVTIIGAVYDRSLANRTFFHGVYPRWCIM